MNEEESLSQEEVMAYLRNRAVEVWEDAFHVRFRNGHLELVVELENTNENTGLWKHFDGLRFMGYEIHILKVPTGSIEFLKKDEK
jgi:hypothetical protein